eukprot:TRINITY_DN8041_c0_g2_i1.p1 TRINITY_DN8041_c0_g2~~TRINITY_DN8041_c0_g2_i1.p1  ORF type:complete len:2018 (+),score=403.81 TRINITY_DN8041_c0_g2_i1:78-6131(+)
MSKGKSKTALGRQLQALSDTLPTTRVAHQPSFLYDRATASDVADETIRHLGLNGFEWLRAQDEHRFAPYEDALVHARKRLEDRTALTRRENLQLDEHIHGLLALLSPYFLHHAAHKVLEFLIRFYRVNEFNVVGVIQCILPFHETEYFSRMVRILHLRDTAWEFLSRFAQSANGLDRPTLVSYCYSDKSVLNTVLNVATHSATLPFMPSPAISFTIATIATLLDGAKSVKEDVIILILGHFDQWCNATQNEKLQIASYTLATMLSMKVDMTQDLVNATMYSVLSKRGASRTREALLCIIQIARHQKLKQLPDSVVDECHKMSNLGDILAEIAASYSIDEFLKLLALSTISSSVVREHNVQSLQELIQRLPFKGSAKEIAQAAVEKATSSSSQPAVVAACKDILTVIQNIHPAEFDSLVNDVLQKKSQTTTTNITPAINQVADFLSKLVLASGYSSIIDSSTIFSALEHPYASVRRQASESLLTLQESIPYAAFGEKIFARLMDDDQMVVANVLSFHGLPNCASAEDIFTSFTNILQTPEKYRIHPFVLNNLGTWFLDAHPGYEEQVLQLALRFVLSCPQSYPRATQAVFTLLTRATTQFTNFQKNFDTPKRFGLHENPIKKYKLTNTSVEHAAQSACDQLNSVVLQALSKSINIFELTAEKIATFMGPINSKYTPSCVIPVLLASDALKKINDVTYIRSYLNSLQTIWSGFDKISTSVESSSDSLRVEEGLSSRTISEALKPLAGWKHYREFFVHIYAVVISCLPSTSSYSKNAELTNLMFESFAFLARHEAFAEVLRYFLAKFVGEDVIHFLLDVANRDSSPAVAVLRCYQILKILISTMWKSVPQPSAADCALLRNLFPYIFSGVVHPAQVVRQEAIKMLDLLSTFKSASNNGVSSSFRPLNRAVSSIKLNHQGVISPESWSLWMSYLLSHQDRLRLDATYGYFIPKDYSISLGTGNKSEFETWLFSFFKVVSSPKLKYTILRCTRHWSCVDKIQTCLELLTQDYEAMEKLQEGVLSRTEPLVLAEAVRALSVKYSGATDHFFAPLGKKITSKSFFDFTLEVLLQAPLTSLQEQCLNCFTNSFYTSLNPAQQKKTLVFLSKSPASTRHSLLESKVQNMFKEFSLSSSVIQETLADAVVLVAKKDKESNKRSKNFQTVDVVQQLESVTPLLELLQLNATYDYSDKLFSTLFAIVEMSASIKAVPEEGTNVEYAKQLTISLLTDLTEKVLGSDDASEHPKINYETLVDLFSSSSDVVRFQIILLMTNLGAAFLQEFSPNFGSYIHMMEAIVPQLSDDHVSAQIIKSLEKLLPVLVSSGQRSLVIQISRLFVDRSSGMVTACRTRLFSVILKHASEDGLFDIIATCIARSILHKSESLVDFSFIEFAHELAQGVPVQVQVNSIIQLLALCKRVPLAQDTKGVLPGAYVAQYFTPSNVDYDLSSSFVMNALRFVPEHVMDDRFLVEFVSVTNKKQKLSLQASVMNALEKYMEFTAEIHEASGAAPDTKAIKLKEAAGDVAYDGIDALCELQDTKSFVVSITRLLSSPNESIQRRSLVLFQSQVQKKLQGIKSNETAFYTNMAEDFLNLIQTKEATSRTTLITRQTAMLSLEILIRHFAGKHVEKFMSFTPIVAQVLSEEDLAMNASGCLTLAALCTQISKHTLPYLKNIIPPCLQKLKLLTDAVGAEGAFSPEQSNLVLSACILIEAIVKNLSQFLSPYIDSFLDLFLASAFTSEDKEISQKIQSLREMFASVIPPRLLLAPLHKKFGHILEQASKAAPIYFAMMRNVLEKMDAVTMGNEYMKAFKFFLLAFDAYLQSGEKMEITLEKSIFDAFMEMVMKLNESSFKPLFMKLMDWSEFSKCVAGKISPKQLVFHKILLLLVDRLKSIFVPYYGYLFDHILVTLTNPNANANKNKRQKLDGDVDNKPMVEAIQLIFAGLEKCFLHDSAQFIDQDKFEKLYRPLVDQLDRTELFAAGEYLPFVQTYVKPCLAQLAVTISNDVCFHLHSNYSLVCQKCFRI